MNRLRYRLAGLAIGLAVLVGCAMQARQESGLQENAGKASRSDTGNGSPGAIGANKAIEKPGPAIEVEEMPNVQEENSVFFMLGSAFLSRNEKQKLEAIARILKEDRGLYVLLQGYANDNGSRTYNLAVSDSRVSAVAEFLRKHGIQREHIRTEALGSEKVPASCRSSLCRQKSRRVDVVISSGR